MSIDTETYEALSPRFIAETETEAIEQWRRALPDGWEADGDPTVETADLADAELTLYGGIQPWRITGPIRLIKPPEPTEAAVTAGAEALHKRMSQHVGTWEDLPAHVKNWYAQSALDVLNAALPHVKVSPKSPSR